MSAPTTKQLKLVFRRVLEPIRRSKPEFRDQVARDRAWARHYSAQGLRAPIYREIRSMSNSFRIANYYLRAARHRAAASLSTHIVKF